ncbi:hypothetical protein ACHAXR_008311 [Thalassiosira sp. AJA248-18]
MAKYLFIANGCFAAARTAAAATSGGWGGEMKMSTSFVHQTQPRFGRLPQVQNSCLPPLPLPRLIKPLAISASGEQPLDPSDLYDDSLPSSPSSSSWGVGDDWSKLTSDNAAASASFASTSTSSSMNGNFDAMEAASRIIEEQEEMMSEWSADDDGGNNSIMNDGSSAYGQSSSEDFVENAIDMIASNSDYHEPDGVQLYDTATPVSSSSTKMKKGSIDKNGRDRQEDEIAFMIRCNQSPEQLLISQGKALPELTEEAKHSASFLLEERSIDESVDSEDGPLLPLQPKATAFFESSVKKIFDTHSVQVQEEHILDRKALAKWMTACISSPFAASAPGNQLSPGQFKIGPYDGSVSATLSRYSQTHGSGCLTLPEFQALYLEVAWAGYIRDVKDKKIVLNQDGNNAAGRYQIPNSDATGVIIQGKKNTEKMLKKATLPLVWRDLEAHEMFSPAEEERVQQLLEMERLQATLDTRAPDKNGQLMMDECVLFDEYEDRLSQQTYSGDNDNDILGEERAWEFLERKEKSSHKLVEMAFDGKTPKRIRDGEFVFIDEESCIGCSQCAQIAPSTFKMLEDGRARTYSQSNSQDVEGAVMACPVSCMHKVSFDELEEMEVSRDDGDGRTDHRHFGNGRSHIPLFVAGIDSDANHKSSWYHYLKGKCHGSSSCPQRGCFDCPTYAPGENPFFKARHKEAEHIRATDFIESGEADKWRKVVEL